MPFLIKSKKLVINQNSIRRQIGNYYSEDRYYTLLNKYMDSNLSKKSKTLGFIIKYLFKSSNFKHDPEIANGKSKDVLLLDLFCYLCMIGFIAMIIAVVGLSLSSMPTTISGIAAFGKGFIESISSNIVMLVFAVFFLIVTIMWLVMFFRIRKKNKKLSLKDYVLKKLETALKFRFLIKTSSKAKNTISKNNKPVEFYCISKFESQGAAANRWLNIQVINLLASIFDDFDLVFIFDDLSDDEFNELNPIIKFDFKKIDFVKIT